MDDRRAVVDPRDLADQRNWLKQSAAIGIASVKSFVGLLELSVDELLDRGRSARGPAGKRLRREFGQAPTTDSPLRHRISAARAALERVRRGADDFHARGLKYRKRSP